MYKSQKPQIIAMPMQLFADNMRNVAKRLQGCYNLTIRNTNDCRETSGADDLPAGETGKQEKIEINKWI